MPACARCEVLKDLTFNRLVEVQEVTEIQDPVGEPIETWTTERVIRAHRKDVRGWERVRSDQELAERTAIFTMRWFSGLTAKKRLVCEGITYDIEGIAELGRRVALEVTATAIRV